ncbi:hypothetical protein HPB52_018302 [Rhipicephalus sanguineus]|uniref:Reverse transcriptase domain-containing protein n=1 Tax=Rhipicephalus sanguineus TaxID=34632 RepID=A0A9D4PDG4_RHISA|nr:hypothetical protein HPB52_018302 [Rhipicephalus sanguineus]
MLPVDKRYPTQCSLYADDVALWVRGPRRNLTAIRRSLQCSLDAVTSFFKTIGLIVSPTKTEALLIHPRVAAWRAIPKLVLGDRPIPWSKAVTYLGLRIDHRLTWIPAVKLATFKATSVQTALYQGAAKAVKTYALPLVQLAQHRKELLQRQHRMAIRRFMGLPRQLPVAASLAEAQTWPLSLLMLRQALHHVDHLHKAPGGDALLRRLPPSTTPVASERAFGAGQPQQKANTGVRAPSVIVAKLHDRLRGHLLVFTNGSLLVMACCSCGAITNASATTSATRAYRFGDVMAGPLSSSWRASSTRLVGDTMRLRTWDPASGPRLLLDDIAGKRLCHPRTTSSELSLASDPERQQWCLVPAAFPVRPPSLLRMLRTGPHTLNFPSRDSTYINHRDIIAAFSGSGGMIAMTPTHHAPLFFAQNDQQPREAKRQRREETQKKNDVMERILTNVEKQTELMGKMFDFCMRFADDT